MTRYPPRLPIRGTGSLLYAWRSILALLCYDSATVFGVLAPAKTPSAVITRLNREMVKILQSAEGKTALAARGLEAVGSTPQEYREQIKDEYKRYGRIAKAVGIRLD